MPRSRCRLFGFTEKPTPPHPTRLTRHFGGVLLGVGTWEESHSQDFVCRCFVWRRLDAFVVSFSIVFAAALRSTYCGIIQEHFKVALRRTCRVVNLDPAAENFAYDCYVDVRELISVDDAMEELDYGPNGGLIFAMEYLSENMSWLEEQISDALDDDYYIFDCPGQIELYSHLPVMREVVDMLQNQDFRVAGVYCIDVNFIEDAEGPEHCPVRGRRDGDEGVHVRHADETTNRPYGSP
ncbi:unnamed protein product [Durusdinium trenchii]|uniref:GPN-loop GTPase 3 n=1 Tax=Durusdinium trenchii TaxID=1381693 RepID=A0ABP0NRD5_9DINO